MKQGEIWLINLDPAVGAEMRKTRPALIINHDALGKLPLLTRHADLYSQPPAAPFFVLSIAVVARTAVS